MSVVGEYRALVGEVAAIAERAARETQAAEEFHAAGQRRVDELVGTARGNVATRREELVQAREEVRRADATAERIWRDVRSYVGRRAARRYAEIPEATLAPAGTDPERLLAEAKELLGRARRGEWSSDPVRYAGILAVLIGAVVAASIFGLARIVLGFGTEETLLSNLLAQLAVFLSPFAGIPLVVWGMARFRGQRTGVGTVACTVVGGLVVSCALTFFIR